jgi:hypothetical protein
MKIYTTDAGLKNSIATLFLNIITDCEASIDEFEKYPDNADFIETAQYWLKEIESSIKEIKDNVDVLQNGTTV